MRVRVPLRAWSRLELRARRPEAASPSRANAPLRAGIRAKRQAAAVAGRQFKSDARRRRTLHGAKRDPRWRTRFRRNAQVLELASDDERAADVLAIDEALSKLAQTHPEKAELVKLRYFAGLTLAESAAALGVSTATAERHWRYARAWLARELE